MHWLTRHLLSERQVPLMLGPLFFLLYGLLLTVTWQNGVDLLSCLSFMVTYMVIDYLAHIRKYGDMLGTMPIAAKTLRLVSYQYIGFMGFIYSCGFISIFLMSELFYDVFSIQQRFFVILLGLSIMLLVVNGLLFLDVWVKSPFTSIFMIFLLFVLVLSKMPQMEQIIKTIQAFDVLVIMLVSLCITYAVWARYPKRLQRKDVS